MLGRSVVPDNDVAWLPTVAIRETSVCGVLMKKRHQLVSFFFFKSVDITHVGTVVDLTVERDQGTDGESPSPRGDTKQSAPRAIARR